MDGTNTPLVTVPQTTLPGNHTSGILTVTALPGANAFLDVDVIGPDGQCNVLHRPVLGSSWLHVSNTPVPNQPAGVSAPIPTAGADRQLCTLAWRVDAGAAVLRVWYPAADAPVGRALYEGSVAAPTAAVNPSHSGGRFSIRAVDRADHRVGLRATIRSTAGSTSERGPPCDPSTGQRGPCGHELRLCCPAAPIARWRAEADATDAKWRAG
jgi:hypothetical protein